ncbi:TRAF3-interacting protein 1-like [Euwallacea similis]|uniref:TRAF3-interacting protein 1-like n=1 Tax=Euwallacea similis TaxID=1736056 RepID=UPI00344FCCB6
MIQIVIFCLKMSEISFEVIIKTQKSLGKYVKKPILTDKLLKKPPFRFLHDVIKAVIKETGFMEGLFSEAELISDNVKEKDTKIAFLTKLIDAVKTVSKTDLKVRPSKIVAGLEPVETNILLQTIAKLIDRKIDTKSYVASLNQLGQLDKKSSKGGKIDKKTSSNNNHKARREGSLSRPTKKTVVEAPKNSERGNKESARKSKKEKIDTNNKCKEESARNNIVVSEEPSLNVEIVTTKETIDETLTNNSVVVTDNTTVVNNNSDIVTKTPPAILENPPNLTAEVKFSNPRQGSAGLIRPKSARPISGDRNAVSKQTLRPPSVRPSSARPGAPRLRPDSALPPSGNEAMGNIKVIVESFDGGSLGDEETTVVVHNASEVVEDDLEEVTPEGTNKGQLVEQILEQIQEGGMKTRKVEINWEQDGLRGKDATTKEVGHLRDLIQSLTKTGNTLGKLMNYLHEDFEAMHNELQMWTDTKRQLYGEIEKQKKAGMESSRPLQDKLGRLRENIKRLEGEVLGVRGNILRNEERISELLGSTN